MLIPHVTTTKDHSTALVMLGTLVMELTVKVSSLLDALRFQRRVREVSKPFFSVKVH